MENKIKDIIIKDLEEAGDEVEIDNGTLIVDDYDTNNGVFCKSRNFTINKAYG